MNKIILMHFANNLSSRYKKLCFLSILFLGTEFVSGQTIFVNDNSRTGDIFTTAVGNDNNAGTAASPYLTLSKAISMASAGATIRVDVGSYSGSFTINKNVTLQGANFGTLGYGTRTSETIILSSKVTCSGSAAIVIDGFHFNQLGNTNGGTLFVNNTPVTIQNCRIERNASSSGITPMGIEVVNSTAIIRIQRNFFTGNRSFGYSSIHRTWNTGIWCNGGTNVTISDNRFFGTRTAINLDNPSVGVGISNNDFQENGTGLAIGGSTASSITYTMTGNTFAVISGTTTFNLANVATAFRLNVTNNTFGSTLAANMTITQCFSLESTIAHKNSTSTKNGMVIYQTGKLYRTSTTTLANNILYAGNNNTIYVAAGTISETVNINKPLKLFGNNFDINPNTTNWSLSTARLTETVINGNGGITISANDVEVNGFRVANATATAGMIGIGNANAPNYAGVIIRNNIITNNTNVRAIYFATASGTSCTGIQVNNNRIESNTITSPRSGIELQAASGASVSNNFVSGSSDHGILINGFGVHTITNNRVDICRITGIGVQASFSNNQEVSISNNTISACQAGIALLAPTSSFDGIKFNITGNNITSNLERLDVNNGAIVIRSVRSGDGSSTNLIQQNQITFSATANIGSSKYGTITGSPATAAYGIWISGNTGALTINANTLNGGNVNGLGVTFAGLDMAALLVNVNTSIPYTSGSQNVSFAGSLVFSNNDCRNFTNGISVVNTVANSQGDVPTGSSMTMNNNFLVARTSGKSILYGASGTALAATCNWYGFSNNLDVLGTLTGNITYSPFLVNGTDNNGSTSGFEPLVGACSGYSIVEPTLAASNLVVTAVGQFSLGFRFNKGNGTNRVVLGKRGAVVSANPVNNSSYTGNSVFGSGSAFSDSSFAVYVGSDSNVTVTGLLPGNTYHFKVFEFNADGAALLYLTNLNFAISISTLPPDADNDGVPNADDQFPDNPNMAFVSSYPAASYATLMFEDLWPAIGDYDFNDLVLSYRYEMVTNSQNQLVELNYTFITRAIGGALRNGFAFQLDGIAPNKITSVNGSKASGAPWIALNANGTEAGQNTNANFIVFDDAYKLLPTFGGYSFVNVSPGAPSSGSDTINLSVKFLVNGQAPEGGVFDFADWSPTRFNPYIIVGQNRANEIHLKDKLPSSKANLSLFGTMADASNPATGKYYRSKNNLPWAIEISNWIPYPQEKTDISEAYLHFIEWVESSGSSFPLWYTNADGYRNSGKLWNP